jgi:hypothetical protein
VSDDLTPEQRALARTAEKLVKRRVRRFIYRYPALDKEEIRAVAQAAHLLATGDFDPAKNDNYLAHVYQRLGWALADHVRKHLAPALHIFHGAARAAARHGGEVVRTSDYAASSFQDPDELLAALVEEHADMLAGRIFADLGAAQGEDGMLARLDHGRFMAAVDDVMAERSAADRDLWRRRFEAGETHEEIARAHGFSTETAKRRVKEVTAAVRASLLLRGMTERP